MTTCAESLKNLLRRLVREEDGQDVVEYALLGATIGFAGIAALSVMGATMGAAYTSWNSSISSIWATPPPQSP